MAENTTEYSNYVLLYSVNLNADVLRAARKTARDNGKKLVIITLRNKKIHLEREEYDSSTCSPYEFIGLINRADIVITNSFHGTVFSILLEKEFYLVRNQEAGLDNSRLDMLLKMVELESRIWNGEVDYDSKIDYINVNDIVEKLRENSISNLLGYMSS